MLVYAIFFFLWAYFRQEAPRLDLPEAITDVKHKVDSYCWRTADGRTLLPTDLPSCSEDSRPLWQSQLSSSSEFLASSKWILFTSLSIPVVSWKTSSFVSNSCYFKSDRLHSSKTISDLSSTANKMDPAHRKSVATNTRRVKTQRKAEKKKKCSLLRNKTQMLKGIGFEVTVVLRQIFFKIIFIFFS